MRFSEFLQEGDLVQIANDEDWDDTFNGNLDLSSWEPKLTSLRGSPTIVTGYFDCSANKLASLKHGPTRVMGEYNVSENPLKNLDGIAEYIGGTLYLNYLGGITSLKDIHKRVKHVGNKIVIMESGITSHVLGLLLINGVTEVTVGYAHTMVREEWSDIINNYLPNYRGNHAVLDCQNELIDAGLDDYAQL
jgi:hypothetical protein